jgi:hypothetical protein
MALIQSVTQSNVQIPRVGSDARALVFQHSIAKGAACCLAVGTVWVCGGTAHTMALCCGSDMRFIILYSWPQRGMPAAAHLSGND